MFPRRFISPEFIPPRQRTNPLKFYLERKDMLQRRNVLNIPEFYVGKKRFSGAFLNCLMNGVSDRDLLCLQEAFCPSPRQTRTPPTTPTASWESAPSARVKDSAPPSSSGTSSTDKVSSSTEGEDARRVWLCFFSFSRHQVRVSHSAEMQRRTGDPANVYLFGDWLLVLAVCRMSV